MKKVFYLLLLLAGAGWGLQGCDDGETYAEQREKERDAISAFLNRDVVIRTSDGEELIHVGKINTISEGTFYAQDSTTNLERNEYVVFENTGVYMQIVRKGVGEKLKSGKPHDGRAPDYDDWQLNGDILFWFDTLNCALEISSMGIRVDEKSLEEQLVKAGCEDRRNLPYHRMLLNGELPYTIGGGIGQSRLCMLLLDRAHVGEVQASIWPEAMREECMKLGMQLI